MLNEMMTNEEYLKSPEWLQFVEDSRKAEPRSYTVIYRDTNGELSENWHFIAEMNIDYVKEKYTKSNKTVLYFVQKELPFGELLKKITAKSQDDQ